ncbi:hypothetical protein M0R04_15835 [Candidatus Dojkabacteria bacterium]|nr:hypothetical protein [Candidatus Dojkabacteria bacterium]
MKFNKFKIKPHLLILGIIIVLILVIPIKQVGAEMLDRRLFLPTSLTQTFPKDPMIVRSRLSYINNDLLINADGEPRNIQLIRLNLFRDVVYRGIITSIEENEFGYVWIGTLENVPYSYFTIMKVGELFIGNIGSPQGVYEFSNVGGDIYRIIKINPIFQSD